MRKGPFFMYLFLTLSVTQHAEEMCRLKQKASRKTCISVLVFQVGSSDVAAV